MPLDFIMYRRRTNSGYGNQKTMSSGYIKRRGFSAYSSPFMLISQKLTKNKRYVPDFRINTRISTTNLAFPLVKDTFTS